MIGSNRFCHFGGWRDREAVQRSRWRARPAAAADFEAWAELFAGYCDFYARPASAEQRLLVWSWIEAGTIDCLLAVPADRPGRGAVGLAHVRRTPSPLRGTEIGFLDDLFVAPAARGSGAFECLMAAVRDLARVEGWPQVRWITAADNVRARRAYGRLAAKTDWVTFRLDV